MKITGTFLDEISHDIPHQNWGENEWRQEFSIMKSVGIDTVILIRSGYKRWLTYPSKYLQENENCYSPDQNLVSLFLNLSSEYGIKFFFGTYDSGKYWWSEGNYSKEVEINKHVIDEVWKTYGHHPAFGGWYLSQEVSRRNKGIIDLYATLGKHAKDVSEGLPTLISPYIDGTKAVLAKDPALSKNDAVSISDHQKEWNDIFDGIKEVVDIVAFQDGHVELHQLSDYLLINKELADKYGMECWTNAESFDRDMPIKFLPIKWDKLKMKLEAAEQAGMDKAITFEFSHFMSPQSAYGQAGHLLNRYLEWQGFETL